LGGSFALDLQTCLGQVQGIGGQLCNGGGNHGNDVSAGKGVRVVELHGSQLVTSTGGHGTTAGGRGHCWRGFIRLGGHFPAGYLQFRGRGGCGSSVTP